MKRRSFLAALSAFVAAPVALTRQSLIAKSRTPPIDKATDVYRYKITYVTADGRELTPPLEEMSFGNRILYRGVYDPPNTLHPQWFKEDEKH